MLWRRWWREDNQRDRSGQRPYRQAPADETDRWGLRLGRDGRFCGSSDWCRQEIRGPIHLELSEYLCRRASQELLLARVGLDGGQNPHGQSRLVLHLPHLGSPQALAQRLAGAIAVAGEGQGCTTHSMESRNLRSHAAEGMGLRDHLVGKRQGARGVSAEEQTIRLGRPGPHNTSPRLPMSDSSSIASSKRRRASPYRCCPVATRASMPLAYPVPDR